MDPDKHQQTRERFAHAVNMEPADLRSWLATDESQAVGWPKNRAPGEESIGHASGRRILQIVAKVGTDLTEDDYAHMRKVVGYIHRHLKQRPRGDVAHTRWRYSLMNWGHDPLK